MVEVDHPSGPSWLLASDADRAAADDDPPANVDRASDADRRVAGAPAAGALAAGATQAAAGSGRAGGRSGRPGEVRLLGAFDSLLLGYADRRLHLTADQARLVNPGGGILKPLLSIDGRVVGTWSRPSGMVEVHPFRPLIDDESAAVDAEADDVVRFLRRGPSPRT